MVETGVAGSARSASVKPKDASDALEAALAQLGPFGFYQGYVLVMLCIPNLFSVMYSLNYVFVADQVPFRCVIPECERGDVHFDNELAVALLPNNSQCQRYLPLQDDAQCEREHFHSVKTVTCQKFVYENYNTVFAEFDLGCREWLRTMVGTVRNAALPLSLILTGYTSDTYGRRTAFCIFSAFAGFMGIIKSFSLNYEMYLALEFLEAALGYGFNSAAYVLMLEMAHPSLRGVFACATGVAYGVGGVLFAWIAWGVPYWRHLLWTIHSLALLLPIYYILLDESPRWLHSQGNIKKTDAMIRKAAAWNKVIVDEEIMKRLNEDVKNESENEKQSPWKSLFHSRVLLIRFALCCWCWIASTFVYYGLTINSVSLSGNKYVNFALNMSMEIAASLLIMMALERIGRKLCIFLAFLLCGVACVSPFFIKHSGTSLGLFFVGKLAITFAFNSLYVFTAELYPTYARSSALAASSLVGRLGSVLAPQTPLLNMYVQAVLYGACCLSAAVGVLFMPETRHARLPQHVDDAERMRTDEDRLNETFSQPPPQLLRRYLSADT
ncbi:unnamed protein product [Arctia plantaginis]|uniref:Major facilitator superfamily (MFS) profile domain-containing protein n=1 Tax=Arctia plantaginis TaxID=874455 RepID=A0A8S1AMM9_ARCPL|nr:unnamed protein product [Arctia plantaginis]